MIPEGQKRQAQLSPAVITYVDEASMVDTRRVGPSSRADTTLKIRAFRVNKPLKRAGPIYMIPEGQKRQAQLSPAVVTSMGLVWSLRDELAPAVEPTPP